MKDSPKKSIQGLWAELFMIARARNPHVMLNAWHATPEDRYDFNQGEQRLEVKSSSMRIRQHHFSLEQLHYLEGTKVLIASIFIERAGAGTSAFDLMEQIHSRIINNPDILLHMDRVVGLTLGKNWRHALQERFDQELAEKSVAFFESSTIPTVNPSLPLGVSEVRFKSDLTTSPTINLASYRALGGLFQAALRR
jgi:hypothetical protein